VLGVLTGRLQDCAVSMAVITPTHLVTPGSRFLTMAQKKSGTPAQGRGDGGVSWQRLLASKQHGRTNVRTVVATRHLNHRRPALDAGFGFSSCCQCRV
jgi:hypothetical protein